MGGVHVQVVEIGAQRRRDVVQFGREAIQPLGYALERLVERRGLADEALSHTDGIQSGALRLAGEQGQRPAGPLEELACVPQPLALEAEAHVLAWFHLSGLDLAELEAEHLQLALPLAGVAAHGGQLSRGRARLVVCARVPLGRRRRRGSGRAVEQVQLALELKETCVLELAVEGEAAAQRLFDGGGGTEQAVQMSARAATARELASDCEGVVAVLEERLDEGSGQRRAGRARHHPSAPSAGRSPEPGGSCRPRSHR